MAAKIAGLKPIALEYLYPGMTLTEGIYNHDGTILLLAKGQTLNPNNIQQLKEFNAGKRNILVFANTYNKLRDHGKNIINTLSQEYLEEAVGFSQLKKDTGKLLKDVFKNHEISKESADYITESVLERMEFVDLSLIFQCINTIKPVDEYLQRHSVNVCMLNGLIGKWLNLTEEQIEKLVLIGLVHDIGKTKIPKEILDAPRKLTLSEFEVVKMHPLYSYELLGTDPRFPEEICIAAKQHHERVNGDGYPDGLRMDQISLFARITAVSDVYDAMVSNRSYKEAKSPFDILAQLSQEQFSELDMHIVKTFIERMPGELIGKTVLLSDFSIGEIRFLSDSDLRHPLVEVNGEIKKTNKQLYCLRMILDE